MMRILVISDTHGDIDKARDAIRKNNNISLIIHLGDYFRDAQKISDEFPDIPIEYIYGNSDFMIDDTPAEKLLEYGGKKIFMTHGHRYSVNWDYEKLFSKAHEVGADILLFGHTHVADIVNNGNCLILNPGSISDARGDVGESYAIIEINNDQMESKLYYA
ncbi:MAG TPA: metallophosphoesterase [Clostridiaceae bacterium]|jgi:putative phosphoesterase|nr:metallophosphoesterase [Clostridiaceae bacterium]